MLHSLGSDGEYHYLFINFFSINISVSDTWPLAIKKKKKSLILGDLEGKDSDLLTSCD